MRKSPVAGAVKTSVEIFNYGRKHGFGFWRFGSNIPSCKSLISKTLHKKPYIKVADLCIAENLQRFLFKHTLLRAYVVLYGENSIGKNLL